MRSIDIRSRVPSEDAQHVVCSLQLMEEYLLALLDPAEVPEEPVEEFHDAAKAKEDLSSSLLEIQHMDILDESEEGAFHRLASSLARSFDAPIALVTATQHERHIWEAQCGLPDDALSFSDAAHDPSVLTCMVSSESMLIIPDTDEDPLSADEPFLRERGIRFYAAVPLKSHDGDVMGSLCVLDTRPRQITEKQKEMLHWIAEVVTTSIELKNATPPPELAPQLKRRKLSYYPSHVRRLRCHGCSAASGEDVTPINGIDVSSNRKNRTVYLIIGAVCRC